MARRKPLITPAYYHVFDRGVAKQEIFLEDFDYARFVESLEVFNTTRLVKIKYERERSHLSERWEKEGTKLVKIHAYTLMTNHYHLVLQQLVDDGIRKFMTKLNGGYAQFFNIKYQRVGPLMQSAYKANLLEKESDLIWATRYVHMNILDFEFPEWRDGGVLENNKDKAKKALQEYQWSDCRIWFKNNKNYEDTLFSHLSER